MFFCYLDWGQRKPQIVIISVQIPVPSPHPSRTLLFSWTWRGEDALRAKLGCEWMATCLLLSLQFEIVCKKKKSRLFSEIWVKSMKPKTPPPCCFASGRLSRSVRNKLSSIASCGQHKTDAVPAWSKLAIKIRWALFSVCGGKHDCAEMCRFVEYMTVNYACFGGGGWGQHLPRTRQEYLKEADPPVSIL